MNTPIKFTNLSHLKDRFTNIVVLVKSKDNPKDVLNKLGLNPNDVTVKSVDHEITINDLNYSDDTVVLYPSNFQEDITINPYMYHYIRYNMESKLPKIFNISDIHCQLDQSWLSEYMGHIMNYNM